ncbi:FUSC family protein [Ancylobacter sonchi]|uniref:FUSC family protein n=1 Tax=Ancylobacter sonchi TaxID=1937790 RepID=UPI001BD575F4|nr:FUSC family protein [Ancylobacter sonchi]MBS7536811.1 FUSC family protein [Ancylobacter sonchi]
MGATPSHWHGDGLGARSMRFALTVMAPISVALTFGVDVWLVYAMITGILAFTLDTGGPALPRLGWMGAAGVIVVAGTGLGTLAAGQPVAIMAGFALAGVSYALVESLDDTLAAGARFLCLTFAVGALYTPLEARDVGVVAGFVGYAWLVSLFWDALGGGLRASTAPALREIYARLRATERQRWMFALAVAITIPLAYLASHALGLRHPYWALIAVVIVLRADALSSRRLIGQMLLGTALGIVAALLYGLGATELRRRGLDLPQHSLLLVGMAMAALLRWPFQQLSGMLGTAALTAFIMLFLEVIAGTVGGAATAMAERLIDVAIGCGFALLALGIDRLGQRGLARLRPP